LTGELHFENEARMSVATRKMKRGGSMQDLIIRDRTLEAPRPSGKEVLEVDGNDTLSSMITWVFVKSPTMRRIFVPAHYASASHAKSANSGPFGLYFLRSRFPKQILIGSVEVKNMQELILWDARLLPYHPDFWQTDLLGNAGNRPPVGNETKMVGESTSLDVAINWIVAKSRQYGGDVWLKIMAHGFEPVVGSQGGGGIIFCREWIRLSTIPRFVALSNRPNLPIGKVKKIEILGCGAAYINRGYEGRDGDGNLLCYRLAQIAQTYVRASTAAQPYTSGKNRPLQFGPWAGTVVTYSPTGAGVSDYPADIR
jgi:hypothetical protein